MNVSAKSGAFLLLKLDFVHFVHVVHGGYAGMVIPPFLTGFARRIYAANFSFCAGVMPPMPMLGRSLL